MAPDDAESLWCAAERLGFMVIGRATEPLHSRIQARHYLWVAGAVLTALRTMLVV